MNTQKTQLPKLNSCCANDDLRPVLNYVYINGAEVTACDAVVLVIHKTEELFSSEIRDELPEKAYIPAEDWVELTKKFKRLEVVGKYLMVHRAKGAPSAVRLVEIDDVGVYPNTRALSPKHFDKVATEEVGINPVFLLRIKDSMTLGKTDALKLEFTGSGRAVRVSLTASKNTIPEFNPEGLIIPCKL